MEVHIHQCDENKQRKFQFWPYKIKYKILPKIQYSHCIVVQVPSLSILFATDHTHEDQGKKWFKFPLHSCQNDEILSQNFNIQTWINFYFLNANSEFQDNKSSNTDFKILKINFEIVAF